MNTELRLHGDQLSREAGTLDFAVNIWPVTWPPALRAALRQAIDDSARYPDAGPALAAVAARHGRPRDEVVLLNGACEAFWSLAAALTPRHAVCVHPAFTEPEAALRAAGIPVTRVHRPAADWRLVPEEVPDEADLVVVGNPNNPTGGLDPAGLVAALARPGRTLVVDESFIELTEEPGESLAARRDLPGLVVVRSLTKLWGLAGVRAGYLLAPPGLASALGRHRQPWSVNAPALAALEVCAADVTTPAAIAAEVAACREDLMERLRRLPDVSLWPAAANFLLLRVPEGDAIAALLAAEGIAVRPARTFPGLSGDYLRLAVRSPADHARLAAALATVLTSL